jgi:ion channel-forming bestrophin family protein
MLNHEHCNDLRRDTFWCEAFTIYESVTPRVLPHVLTIGLLAVAITWIAEWVETSYGEKFGLEIGFHEVGGAILTISLILRTNAGYERWWEARKLWGGIVNQCRNLAISSLCYGPRDPQWREAIVRWTMVFPYVCRSQLQGEPLPEHAISIVGPEAAQQISAAEHMPSFVIKKLGLLLSEACAQGMNPLAFAQVDRERAMLIDHIGGCERILKTPLPQVYSIKIRRILALFLLTLPFVLIDRVNFDWLVPLITIMIAYPLISLDQIGHELQNPFSTRNLSHLPLTTISAGIESNLSTLLKQDVIDLQHSEQSRVKLDGYGVAGRVM